MSTPVTVPASVAAEDHNEHVDRLKVGRLEADTLVVGNRGTVVGSPWQQTSATLTGGALGTALSPENIVRFTVIGKTCTATYRLSHAGGAGTATGVLTLSAPVRPRGIGAFAVGSGLLTTTGGVFHIVAFMDSSRVLTLSAMANASGPEFISDTSTAITRLTQAAWSLQLTVTYEIE